MRGLAGLCLLFAFLGVGAQTAPSVNPDLPISCPYNIVFVLDESGSIAGVGANDISSIVRSSSLDLINALSGSGSQVAVVEFNSQARRAVINSTTNYQVVDAAYVTAFTNYINDPAGNTSASANNYDPEDYSSTQYYTNWEAAFLKVYEIDTASPPSGGLAELVIFFTDGNPTAYINSSGNVTQGTSSTIIAQALDDATIAANAVKALGSHIFVVGLPNPSLDTSNVKQISGPDRYPNVEPSFIKGDYSVSSSQTLQDDLQRIAASVCKVDLRLQKTADDNTPCTGDTIVFTINLFNDGLDNASLITVTDTIPSGFTYISDNGGANTSISGNVLTWSLDSLPAMQSTSIQITAVVNISGSYTNTVQVISYQGDDVDSTNNAADVTVSLLLNCDNGDPCTVDYCQNGICVHDTICCFSNAECADTITCTLDTCIQGTCFHFPIICDDQNPCTIDFCIDGICGSRDTICNDQNPCTIDACVQGICTFTDTICNDQNPCTIDECIGGICMFRDTICNDQNPCTIDFCDGGICIFRDTVCNDQNPCTIDACVGGNCIFRDTICNDQNPCTIDRCVQGTCVFTDTICNDQNPCTIDECVGGICMFRDTICNDQNPCTIDVCDGGICIFRDTVCNDQNPCTIDECIGGVCMFRDTICNDQDPCTIDACVGGTCIFRDTICNDQNPCTIDVCEGGTCIFRDTICNDQNPCTIDACIGGTCIFRDTVCTDGNPCTIDECVNGVCMFRDTVCNDNDPCTVDSCVLGQCIFTDIVCDDSNPCTIDTCINGHCVFTQKVCNDGQPCTKDTCINGQCIFTAIVCDDGLPCTHDFCDAYGVCQHAVNCADRIPCTLDFCDSTGNCQHIENCDDGIPCTNDFCDANGVCQHVLNCNDGLPCTTDFCDGSGNCQHVVNCDDRLPCTTDFCDSSGICQHVFACEDNNPCTVDSCDSNGDCLNIALDCDDNDPCTIDLCDNGACTHICGGSSNHELEWQKALGGRSGDGGFAVQQTTDGGYIVTGYTWSNNADVSGNHGQSDFWLVKLTGAGNVIWQSTLGGTKSEFAYAVRQTNDGGYIVAGSGTSNDGDASGNHGGQDFWVVKMNSLGGVVWQKSLGGNNADAAYSVSQTTDNGYVVAGWTSSNNGNVSGNHGGSDFWVVKLDAAGTLQWQKPFGGSGGDAANSVQQTTDGGYIVAGSTLSNNGNVSGNHGGKDFWVVKLDTTGSIVWQKALGGTGNDIANSIRQTTDGGYIVAGTSASNNGDVSGNHGGDDYWVVKLDAAGNLMWQKSLGGSGADQGWSVEQTSNGGYVVAGSTLSNDNDVSGNHGGRDFWLVQLDASGNIEWQKTLGGTNNEVCQSVMQTSDNGFILAGNTASNNGDVTGLKGGSDYWLVKLAADQSCAPFLELTEVICAGDSFYAGGGNQTTPGIYYDTIAMANGCDSIIATTIEWANCDDGDPCTRDTCIKGSCFHDPVICTDGDPCTIDDCGPNGCFFTPMNCEDNNPCTVDSCAGGTCLNIPMNCEDGNPCTLDTCVNGICHNTPLCMDNNPCTYDTCIAGACSFIPIVCDDGNPCTVDQCVNGICDFAPTIIDAEITKTDASCGCGNQDQLCVLDFAGLRGGSPLLEQYAAYGIHISAVANPPGKNAAIVFNSYASGTPDPDLEVSIGNLMIIAQNLIDINPVDGLVDNPNDNNHGGIITILFDYPRTIESFVFVDEEEGSFAVAYDALNQPLDTAFIPALGDGSVQTVPMNVSGVRKLIFVLDGSGGITDIKFSDCCCNGTAIVSASGGTPPYTFQWSNGSEEDTVSELCANTYCVTVNDVNGCQAVVCTDLMEIADNFEITGFTLVYESTIGEIGPLTNGLVIDRDTLCRYNVRADVCGNVASVKFFLNGSLFRTENVAPFALGGDNPPGDYYVWSPLPGNYTITAIPYSQLNGGGTAGIPYTVMFAVVDSTPGTVTSACTETPCPAQASITQIEQPFFCQADSVLLLAQPSDAVSYLWSTGATATAIHAAPATSYSVTITNVHGCEASASITTSAAKDLLSSYVILGITQVNLDHSTVLNGGVGVTNSHANIVAQNSTMIAAPGTFTSTNNLILSGGSVVTTQNPTFANVTLPTFEYNTLPAGANVSVPANTTMTLPNNLYGLVQIGANSTVTFPQPEINLSNLATKENVTIRFSAPCTKVKIQQQMFLGMNNKFNPDSIDVIVFAEGDVKILDHSKVIADIYTLQNLEVEEGTPANPTSMTGMFIGLNVFGEDYSYWHVNRLCRCGVPPRGSFKTNEGAENENVEFYDNAFIKAYPNPFNDQLNIEFSLKEKSHAQLEIFSISGRQLAVLFNKETEANELQSVAFTPGSNAAGIVIYRLQTDKAIYYGKAVMVR